jgi:hypothetical protein
MRQKNRPSNRIGIALLVVGVISISASIYSVSLTLAFIGLSLTFWGALFLFIRPTQFVRTDVVCSAVTPFYNTVDRIIDDLKCVGKPTYVPPYPKDVFLPEYLKGLKELVVFIATEETSKIPTLEMAKQQFVVYDPKGV